MEFDKFVDDRDRLTRTLLAGTLAVVAIRSFRKKRRLLGTLAGVGAVGLGYTAAVGSRDLTEESAGERERESDADTAGEDGGMRCPVCNEPILVGQSRRPNADNQIVHEGCL